MEVLGSSLAPDEPLMSGGLDSLGAVEYVNLVSRRLGVVLPSTLVSSRESRTRWLEARPALATSKPPLHPLIPLFVPHAGV